jgi:hypothetical protein
MARRPGVRAGEPVTHTAMELLEVSMVAIPANREAVRLRGVEEDEPMHEEKAGRRLSKASAAAIAQAIALLQGLLAEEGGDAPEMEMDGMKPKPKGLDVPDEVAAKLAAFAKEATNG